MDRNKYKDVFAKWQMHRDWKTSWVKDAFVDIHHLITTKLTSSPVKPSRCVDQDVADILEKHLQGDRALYQSVFVALILDALKSKTTTSLTFGYRSPLLSFLLSKVVEEHTDQLLKFSESERLRNEVLQFFDM